MLTNKSSTMLKLTCNDFQNVNICQDAQNCCEVLCTLNRKLILTERDTEDHSDNSNNKTCTDW